MVVQRLNEKTFALPLFTYLYWKELFVIRNLIRIKNLKNYEFYTKIILNCLKLLDFLNFKRLISISV